MKHIPHITTKLIRSYTLGDDYMTYYMGYFRFPKRWKNYRTIVSRTPTSLRHFLAGKSIYIKKYL